VVAEGAFLHHSLRSERDIPIEGTSHLFWPFGGIPVEILYGVRASRRTVSAADATVIDLCHQSLFIDISSVDRTDLHTGGMIAMHAGPWEKPCLDVWVFPFNIRDKFNPVNGAPLG
jgi:hypothetical protein